MRERWSSFENFVDLRMYNLVTAIKMARQVKICWQIDITTTITREISNKASTETWNGIFGIDTRTDFPKRHVKPTHTCLFHPHAKVMIDGKGKSPNPNPRCRSFTRVVLRIIRKSTIKDVKKTDSHPQTMPLLPPPYHLVR